MATSYILQAGYPSQFSTAIMTAKLVAVVDDIQEHPRRLVAEVLRLEPDLDHAPVAEYAERYRKPVNDLTLTKGEDDDGWTVFRQLASGSGESRDIKEALRRALLRLVTEAMHRERMEVSFIVC